MHVNLRTTFPNLNLGKKFLEIMNEIFKKTSFI